VSLEAELADEYHHRVRRKLVVALADTLYVRDSSYGGATNFIVPVYLRNTQPVKQLILPISYPGEANLEYVAFDTIGCRTDYFSEVAQTGQSDAAKKVSFRLTASGTSDYRPPLEPGDGPIINLHFTRVSGQGTNVIDTTTLSGRVFRLDADYVTYIPAVRPGNLTFSVDCGDIDGDGTVATITDLVWLVSYFFSGGLPPVMLEAADVDGANGLNIADIVFIVDYMFNGGPPPHCGW
jgi:hypothetical protein